MDTTKFLIPAVALALSHSIEEHQPACGIEPVRAESARLACRRPMPALLHIEPADTDTRGAALGPSMFTAIPGLAIPGLAVPGVGMEPFPIAHKAFVHPMVGGRP
jgi:hypothetical protein